MSIVTEFTLPYVSCQMFLKDGTPVIFTRGKARLTKKAHIDELMEEIENGHPYLRCAGEKDTTKEDPLFGLKARMREELLAEIKATEAAATNPNNDMGGTTTNSVVAGAASSDLATIQVGAKSVPVVPAKPTKSN